MNLEATERAARVLVVDDEDINRLMTCESLRQSGFEVLEAADGAHAVSLFATEDIDIVLLDVVMPGMNGFEACKQMRAIGERALVPIVMMTGLDDVDSITRAYEVGATDFISKPLNFTILQYRVRYVLRAARTARDLTRRKRELATAQRIARVGHFQWDLRSHQFACSEDLSAWLGLPQSGEVDGLEVLLSQVSQDDRPAVLTQYRSAITTGGALTADFQVSSDEQVMHLHHEAEVLIGREGQAISVFGTMQDVTALRSAEAEIRQLANFDPVTGVYNRQGFVRQLREFIDAARREQGTVAVLSIDLDHFKRINDVLGHAEGDELLREIVSRLTQSLNGGVDNVVVHEAGHALRRQFHIGRLGGDDFIVALAGIDSPETAALTARRIRMRLRQPIRVAGSEIEVTASIGISAFPIDGGDADSLILRADAAMHHAKSEGRDRYQFSTPSINSRAENRLSIEARLREGLRDDAFCLFYQPKVSILTGEVVGAEALARWNHPELGVVGPAEFIPIAEETGLIRPISQQLFVHACSQIARWMERAAVGVPISVNLSPAQFRQENLAGILVDTIRQYRIPPEQIEFEVTESLLMSDIAQAVALMRSLREAGAALSIDDFGTGYSSLAYLKDFPVSTLKIDRAFVTQMERSSGDEAIVRAVVGLAHSIDLKVVAEGVEEAGQLSRLRELECDVVQGYLIGEPMPADEFEKWLTAWQPDQLSALSGSTASTRSRAGCVSADLSRSSIDSLKLGTL